MKRAMLLCASGIGDGLLMMIVAYHLKLANYRPTIFHDSAQLLSPLFQSYSFYPHVPFKDLETLINQYERVIVENDHSPRALHIFKLREKISLKHVTIFFPTYSIHIKQGDFLFNPKCTVATNLAIACQKIFGTPNTKKNDLTLPADKRFKKYPKRVIIHPTSNDPKRNWKQTQFIALAKKLKQRGFSVAFCIHPKERSTWEGIDEIFVPQFSHLHEIKDYIYESGFLIGNDSGLGHLASNLNIPTLTIAGNPKRIRLWRPDWLAGKVVTIPFPLPNFKGINFCIRDNYWQNFIHVSKVYNTFIKLVHESSRCLL